MKSKSKSLKQTQPSGEQNQAEEKAEDSKETETQQILEDNDKFNKKWKHESSHPKDPIIGNIKKKEFVPDPRSKEAQVL